MANADLIIRLFHYTTGLTSVGVLVENSGYRPSAETACAAIALCSVIFVIIKMPAEDITLHFDTEHLPRPPAST